MVRTARKRPEVPLANVESGHGLREEQKVLVLFLGGQLGHELDDGGVRVASPGYFTDQIMRLVRLNESKGSFPSVDVKELEYIESWDVQPRSVATPSSILAIELGSTVLNSSCTAQSLGNTRRGNICGLPLLRRLRRGSCPYRTDPPKDIARSSEIPTPNPTIRTRSWARTRWHIPRLRSTSCLRISERL